MCRRPVCTPLPLSLTCSRLRPPTWAARASATTDIISTIRLENRPLDRAKPKVKHGERKVKPIVSMSTSEVVMFYVQFLAHTEAINIVSTKTSTVMFLTWFTMVRASTITVQVVNRVSSTMAVLCISARPPTYTFSFKQHTLPFVPHYRKIKDIAKTSRCKEGCDPISFSFCSRTVPLISHSIGLGAMTRRTLRMIIARAYIL